MTTKPTRGTQAGVDTAMDNLAAARTRVTDAKRRQALAREAKAKALVGWTALFPKPSLRQMIEAVNKTQAAREAARAQSERAEPASHLDAVLKSGMGGSVNYGYRRPRAALRHGKPPSVR